MLIALGAAGVKAITVIESDGKFRLKLEPFPLSVRFVFVSDAAPVELFFGALSSADPYCHDCAEVLGTKPLIVKFPAIVAGVPVPVLLKPVSLLLTTSRLMLPLDSLTAKTSRFVSVRVAEITVPPDWIIFDASCSAK